MVDGLIRLWHRLLAVPDSVGDVNGQCYSRKCRVDGHSGGNEAVCREAQIVKSPHSTFVVSDTSPVVLRAHARRTGHVSETEGHP